MLKKKCDMNQQYLKTVDLHFVKSEKFEVVFRVSESENSDWIIWRLKG